MCCCWVRFVGYDVWFQKDFLGFLEMLVEDVQCFFGKFFSVISSGKINRGHFCAFIERCLSVSFYLFC